MVDWDFFLLGLVTGIAGILGLPFPNGLIPQAPFHTASLCVVRTRADPDEKNKGKQVAYVERVVEQRVTNLAQGLLILVTMSPPLLHVLGLIPQGVLAGLFFVMGVPAWKFYALSIATRTGRKWNDSEDNVASERQGYDS
jgi:boron transporter